MAKREQTAPAQVAAAASRKVRNELRQLLESLRNLDTGSTDSFGAPLLARQELSDWESLGSEAIALLRGVVEAYEAAREEVDAAYPAELRRALIGTGLHVDGDDSMPIVGGMVHVVIDRQRGRITVNDEALGDNRIAAVVEAIRFEQEGLAAKATAPSEFLASIHDAYRREIAVRGKPDGTQVETVALLGHLLLGRQTAGFLKNPQSSGFRPYPLKQFRCDLYLLLASTERQIDGLEFHHGAGADTSGAVFMLDPALGRAAHVGRIWFSRGDQN